MQNGDLWKQGTEEQGLEGLQAIRRALEAAQSRDLYPLHMPGHKRRGFPGMQVERNWRGDWTEIPGLDNLHEPEEAISISMKSWAKRVGAAEARYLVNGSSGGIWAALYAALRPGERILVARNAHRSVYGALEVLQLDPVFLLPPWIQDWGIWGSVSPEQVREKLRADSSIRAVLLTSPTYEGVLSDLPVLAEICHEAGVLLMVDSAHGAHLRECGMLSGDAVAAGADLVVESLHKTLPALTPAAVLYRSECIDPHRFAQGLRLFQTSSPSYLLLASIEGCLAYLQGDAGRSHAQLREQWVSIRGRLTAELRHLRLFQEEYEEGRFSSEQVWGLDAQKLLVGLPTGCTGAQAANWMREKSGLEWEMVQAHMLLGILTPADCGEGVERVAEALLRFDRSLDGVAEVLSEEAMDERTAEADGLLWALPDALLPPGRARREAGLWLPFEQTTGYMALEMVYAYPPGIPLILPGERISRDFLQHCREMTEKGLQWISESGAWPLFHVAEVENVNLTGELREPTIE